MNVDFTEIDQQCERLGIFAVESFTDSSEWIQVKAITEFLDYIERLRNA